MNFKQHGLLKAFLLSTIAWGVLFTAGCGGKVMEPFKDSAVSSHRNEPAEVIEMPDGFNNLADVCDGHGHRVYSTFHGNSGYGSIAVVADPTCKD